MNIYTKKHSILISNSHKEERKSNVKVEIQNHNNGLSKKELFIRLTDEDSLSFLFCLKINQENFQEIKSQQGLLVDFCAFGQRLIDLFNMCGVEEENESPKYVLKLISNGDVISSNLSTTQWTLNFIETNPFKHLIHLSLRFCHGDSETFKNYLIECLKATRVENSNLSIKLSTTESSLLSKLKYSETCLSEAQDKITHLQESSRAQIDDIRVKLDNQIQSNKEKLLETDSYYKSKNDQEKRDLESNFSKSVRNLELKIGELERTNKCLCDENSKLENDIRENKMRRDSLEESYKQAGNDVQSLRRNKEQCDRTIHELECHVQKLSTRVAVLEQEVRDKDTIVSKTQDMHVNEQEIRNRYQEESVKKAKQIDKLEKVVKNLNEEVSKANDIIQKLQNEVKHYHSKIKVRNQIATEQEKAVNERDLEIKKLNSDLEILQKQLSQREDECQKTTNNLEEISKKLEEATHLIKTNENVINWLNRQVTEYELMKQKCLPGSQLPRPLQTPQFYANSTDSMVKYRPTSSVSTASTVDNYSTAILAGLNTKNKYIPNQNQNSNIADLSKPPNQNTVSSSHLDRNINSHQLAVKDQRYIPKLSISSGPQCSTEQTSYGQNKNILCKTNMPNAGAITEESDHQQSLSSAYFPKALLGPR